MEIAVQPHRAAGVREEEAAGVREERAHRPVVQPAETRMPLMGAAEMAEQRVVRVAAGVVPADAIGMAVMQTDARVLMARTEAQEEQEVVIPQGTDLQLRLW